MVVGVISDTHDNLPKIKVACDLFAARGVRAIVHAGDFVSPFALRALLKGGVRLVGVFGNNDGERRGLSQLCPDVHNGPFRFELSGKTILIAHSAEAIGTADQDEADLLVYGHTHRAELTRGRPLRVNPGEAGGWLSGRCTVAVVDLDTMRAEIVDLGPQETTPL